MKYLLYSLAVFLTGCGPGHYAGMHQRAAGDRCASVVIPAGMETNWYKGAVDVMGRRLSGLLLIKQMPEQNFRIVFTNEGGLTYFDIEFLAGGDFKLHKIIRQMDKKPVINLLRDDFSLLLGFPFNDAKLKTAMLNGEVYHGVDRKRETVYFITDEECASLRRLEAGSRRKRKLTITFEGAPSAPESIVIKHHNFDMVMNLKKIKRT